MVELPKLRCKVCNHEWFLRTTKLPKVCAKCKSYKWNGTPINNKQPESKEEVITKELDTETKSVTTSIPEQKKEETKPSKSIVEDI